MKQKRRRAGGMGVKRILTEVNCWCIPISELLNAVEVFNQTKKGTQNPKMKSFFLKNFGSGNTSLKPIFVSWGTQQSMTVRLKVVAMKEAADALLSQCL